MSDSPPPDNIDATRAALEPTLRAVADILPLIAKAREPRFSPELAARWQSACQQLAQAWNDRHCGGLADFRPAIFELCAIAIELNDADCLQLSEALASASDLLEDPQRRDGARLLAAISATCECLNMDDGIEHPLFSQRARHLTERLHHSAAFDNAEGGNPALLRIFFGEAQDRLQSMYEAFDLLPPDAYAIKTAAEEIILLAEPLELFDIIDRARILVVRLTPRAGENLDLDDQETRDHVLDRITLIEEAIAEIGEEI